ncbi:hypothetical protein GGF32_001675 [Allomyces javanicus]|nr:hypothetical protein GGF32_001675 [Allomyces javanicus]
MSTKRPAPDTSSSQGTPKKKSKFVNDTYLSDDEFGQGRWMVTVFREFPNEFQATPHDIIQRAVVHGFIVEGTWRDPHQGIRSYISLWNKKYREMHQHVRADLPCTNGCERKGPHRICSKGRKPVQYWMREQHYAEVYRGRPAAQVHARIQRPRPPPRMPRVPFIDYTITQQTFPLQRPSEPSAIASESIVDESVFSEVTEDDFSSLFDELEEQDEIVPEPPRLEKDFVDMSTKDIVAAAALMGLSRASPSGVSPARITPEGVTTKDIVAANVLMGLSRASSFNNVSTRDVTPEDSSDSEVDITQDELEFLLL